MLDTDVPLVERIEQQNLSPWSAKDLLQELKQDRGIVLVAEQSTYNLQNFPSPILGWCAARFIFPEAELLKIAVTRECRQYGIATALLKELTTILQDKGGESLYLEVRSQNTSALKFYYKNDFLQVGRRKNYYLNPKDTALLLCKRL